MLVVEFGAHCEKAVSLRLMDVLPVIVIAGRITITLRQLRTQDLFEFALFFQRLEALPLLTQLRRRSTGLTIGFFAFDSRFLFLGSLRFSVASAFFPTCASQSS